MQITVLSHMPFAGKQRKPGEIISEEIWLGASEAARSALVGQGMVRVSDTEAGEGSSDMIELLQGISAKLDRLLTKDGTAPLAAAPAAAPATRRKRKSKAKAPAKAKA